MDTVIELKEVSKTYRLNGLKVDALADVSLKVNKKDFLAIVGPSGSGKSTLLHISGALEKPTSGKIFIEGTDLTVLKEPELADIRGKKIGFIFQFFNLYPTLTALENICLPMIISGKNKQQRSRRAEELLDLVGLGNRKNHLPSKLSGGERQRVAIARALANNPSFILADEPTGNLDSKKSKEILDTLKKINEEIGTTIIFITHEQSLTSYANRVVEIRDGKIYSETN